LLTPAQIYQKALASTVTLQKLSPAGEKIGTGSGFVIADGLIATAFRVIDGATTVHVVLPGGQQGDVREVVGWNRWQDWAILRLPTGTVPVLKRAKPTSWSVGDRCFFLNAADGARTIADLNVTGSTKYPNAGERLSLNAAATSEATGSPLLNEYGEVIGIVGTGTIPGSSSIGNRLGLYGPSFGFGEDLGELALPIATLPDLKDLVAPTSFSELVRRGEFVLPLTGTDIVNSGSLSDAVDRRPNVSPMPLNPKYRFNHKDHQMFVFVLWNARDKRHALSSIRLYDLSNNLLIQSKPNKLNLSPSNVFSSTDWKVDIDRLPSGTYRLDVVVDDQPVWRSFFTVSD
jgi:hypothetical protein